MAEKATTGFFGSLENTKWDLWLAAATIGLVVFGLVMVYSASGYIAEQRFKVPSYYFLVRQLIWVALGLGAMLVTMRIDYLHYWKPQVVYGLLGISLLLLAAVFFFPARNGAHRWITFGSWSAQPSELAKIALIIFLARFLSVREQAGELGDFMTTVVPASVVAGILALLIIREPDLGTTLMLGIIFIAMMFASGVRIWPLFAFAAPVVLIAGFFFIYMVPWRWERIKIFLDPESDPRNKGFQVVQSLIAVGSGGLSGLGLGEGKQKMSFLPEPHADFIFAVIGEELGFVGAVTVVMVFGFLLWRGLVVSRRAPDRFAQLLSLGLTVMLIAQAFFNISVVLSLVPNKGIPLPFVSAGGSSLLFAMAAIGVLLNISEKAKKV
ncbi:MAG TPA: putative lipid II flippase FtsW [Blastocatellia bacterium]|nr:putative lipid II flippase FtsW [Blastocatellia bacterium]